MVFGHIDKNKSKRRLPAVYNNLLVCLEYICKNGVKIAVKIVGKNVGQPWAGR